MMTRLIPILVLASACSAAVDGKPMPDDDFADLRVSADAKTDSFSKNMKIVATMSWNQTSAPIDYTKTPKYRVVKLTANLGDHLDAWVRSADGDAVAWLLDGSFKVLTSNDDADGDTLDSHLVWDFGPAKTGTYYIALRDYALARATFTVEMDGGPLLKECEVDSDCVRVTANCCGLNNDWDSVHKGDENAFHALLACPAHQICPLYVVADNHAMAECNVATHLCEAVVPQDIDCDDHACPQGWSCDAGSCTQ